MVEVFVDQSSVCRKKILTAIVDIEDCAADFTFIIGDDVMPTYASLENRE
jgi:hypothetical protein